MRSFIRSIVMAPISLLYKWGVILRNWAYDSQLVDSYIPDIPVVSVGNITVGGTGKTPFTEYLIQLLSQNYEVAVLSRGYKRKTSGFVLADSESTFRTIGDEPAQLNLKFPSVHIAVCENRKKGIEKLKELFPTLGVIIMDDAFQHRKVIPWLDIVLMDYHRPIYEDHMLPWGTLRDVTSQLLRADVVITTKCPENLSTFQKSDIETCLNLYPFQKPFYTKILYMDPVPLFPEECLTLKEDGSINPCEEGTEVVVMTGIASPKVLVKHVEEKFTLSNTLLFPDHHVFTMRDMYTLRDVLKPLSHDALVLITEKDAVKLCASQKIPQDIRKRLYYIGIKHEFIFDGAESFKSLLLKHVSENRKHNFKY